MEHYDNRGTPEAFARSVSAFDLLTATLSGRTAGAWTHAELEEHLRAARRALVTSAGVVYRRPLGDLVLRLGGEFGGHDGVAGF
ncbi:hypothetical protein ABT215_40660 [Streptomyces sp900105755]|uniref:hypothetical protein n=1 Tax=Streptomyces sp. 900105755 TaxID=3154389 RepID=UPI0033218576